MCTQSVCGQSKILNDDLRSAKSADKTEGAIIGVDMMDKDRGISTCPD
jgi:hypothetical protein